MRFTHLIVVATIALGSGFSFAHRFPNANAADKVVVADADKVYPMSYRLNDLPVWTQDGKTFNTMALIAYLKTLVDAAGETSLTIAPYESSLVVATTSANHARIQKLLRALREAALTPDAK